MISANSNSVTCSVSHFKTKTCACGRVRVVWIIAASVWSSPHRPTENVASHETVNSQSQSICLEDGIPMWFIGNDMSRNFLIVVFQDLSGP